MCLTALVPNTGRSVGVASPEEICTEKVKKKNKKHILERYAAVEEKMIIEINLKWK